jgi:calcium binding protein 39
VTGYLADMKVMCYGSGTDGAEKDAKASEYDVLAAECVESGVLLQMLRNVAKVEFEARKDLGQIFNFFVRNHRLAVRYIKENVEVLELLVAGYKDQHVALVTGQSLRECLGTLCTCTAAARVAAFRAAVSANL